MTYLLAALLALDTVLHAASLFQNGIRGNVATFVFTGIYAILTIAVAVSVPYAVLATLVLCGFGFASLTVAWASITEGRDPKIDRGIWWTDLAIVAVAAGFLVA